MKKVILALLVWLIACISIANAQNAKVDKLGNYIALVKAPKDSATNTGKTFTDTKGISYPVFQGARGGLFYYRISKTGNKYPVYIKL